MGAVWFGPRREGSEHLVIDGAAEWLKEEDERRKTKRSFFGQGSQSW